MSRRLARSDLKRGAGGGLRRLPAGSLARTAGLCRQAVVGIGCGAACAGAVSFDAAIVRLDASWNEAASRVLIVVPDPSSLPAVLSAAGPEARQADPSPLGVSASLAPALVVADGVHDPDLAARVQAAAPGSIVQTDGGEPARRLARFGDRLKLAGALLVGMAGLVSAAGVAAAGLGGARASANTARVLSELGATDGWINRHLVWPLAAAATAGSAAGFAGMQAGLRAAGVSGHSSPALRVAVPLLAGTITAFTASRVRRAETRW